MYVPFRGAPDRVCMQELESRTESNLQALAAAAAPTVGIGDETPPTRSRAGHLCWNKSLPSYHFKLSLLVVDLLFRCATMLSSKQSYCQPDHATSDAVGNIDQTSDP